MPKVKKIRSTAHSHEPLGQVIIDESYQKKYVIAKKQYTQDSHRDNDNDDDYYNDDDTGSNPKKKKNASFLDEKTSQKIFELSKEQQFEMEAEERRKYHQDKQQQQQLNHQKHSKLDSDDDDDDDDEGDDDNIESYRNDDDDDLVQHTQGGYVTLSDHMMGLSAEEEELVSSMMNPSSERKTLADIILEKIEQKKDQQQMQQGRLDDDDDNDNDRDSERIPQKVIDVYTDIGKVLSHYTSGKLPKAFKVIPSLSNWEEILYLTRPDLWTPCAMYMATRIFASNLNPKMATKFYSIILLDAVRHDIHMNKKLNYHYYMSLKKAVYKPTAFFRGIIIPLVRDPNCTLREAAIVASVLQRVSIPVHHSAVAMHKLATIESGNYNGVTSIFIKTLLNKKYSLPTPVIQSLITHFTNFLQVQRTKTTSTTSTTTTSTLPVLWHQSLLVFVQRYKYEIQSNEYNKELLKKLMKQHYHHKITPEIRRELFGNIQAYKDEQQQLHQEMVLE